MKKRSATGTGFASNRVILFLSVGLLVSLILTLLTFAHVTKWTSNNEAYLVRTSEMQVLALEIAEYSLTGAAGDKVSFDRLRASRDGLARRINELKLGIPAQGLPPSPAGAKDDLREVENSWLALSQVSDDVLVNRDEILSVREFISVITDLVPQLQAFSEEVVASLIDGDVSQKMMATASRQLMLAERIDKNVARVLIGGQVTAAAIDQFSRDADQFGRVLEGMLTGSESLEIAPVTDPQAVAMLREVAVVFSSINDHASEIIQAVPSVLPALEASVQVNDTADLVEESTSKLIKRYGEKPGLIEFAGIRAGIPLIVVLGITALLLLIVLVYSMLTQSRRREEESKAQNEKNQKAILRLLDEMGDLADGDLTVTATVTEDVTGAIADSINYAIEALRSLVTTINEISSQVSSSAQESRATAMHLAEASEHQAEQISQATDSIKTMAVSIGQMSDDSSESAEVSQRSVEIAGNGAETVRRTINGMDTIREQIQETSKRIKRLGESSQEIGDIVELIDDIADQTNILALNAAMQAAMAGEAGRGFAVVADEVQRLAERSGNATKQIEALVKTIQADTNEAVSSMEATTTEVVNGAQLAEAAGEALQEIESVSKTISERTMQVSDLAQQQSKEASLVNDTMSVIQEITTQTSDGTSHTATSIGRLADMADDLQNSVAGFRLPE